MPGRAEFLQSAKHIVRNATRKWLRGEPAAVEQVLAAYPQLGKDATCVLALVWAEYLVRKRRGDKVTPEEFSERFPSEKAHIEKLFAQKLKEHHAALATAGPESRDQQNETQSDDDPIATVTFAMTPETDPYIEVAGFLRRDREPKAIGRFQLKALLGKGAFGKVYRAHDPQLDREVALKVPRVGTVDTEEDASRFLREARAAGQLRHPNIVPVFDAGQIDDTYYIASGFIQGKTLLEVLEKKSAFAPQDAARIIAKMADAIHYAHTRGIVHRDLKPANTMLDSEGEPLVMDFGLARRSEGETLRTTEGSFMGTPAYMSPEQASGNAHSADARTDQWSLGVMLYELLTGTRPFQGDRTTVLLAIQNADPLPLRKHDRSIPRDLENVCLRCLEKHPGKRYRECRDLAEDLESWLRGSPVSARPISPLERLGRWGKRNPAIAGLLGATAALALAFVIYICVNNIRLETQQGDLTRALALADEKSKLASANAQLYLEQKQLAERSADEQKAALDKLKGEVAAREKAENAARVAAEDKSKAEGAIGILRTEKLTADEYAKAEKEKQRKLEDKLALADARLKTEAELKIEEEVANHASRIATIQSLLDSGKNEEAKVRLNECDPLHRGWEWRHLMLRAELPDKAVQLIQFPEARQRSDYSPSGDLFALSSSHFGITWTFGIRRQIELVTIDKLELRQSPFPEMKFREACGNHNGKLLLLSAFANSARSSNDEFLVVGVRDTGNIIHLPKEMTEWVSDSTRTLCVLMEAKQFRIYSVSLAGTNLATKMIARVPLFDSKEALSITAVSADASIVLGRSKHRRREPGSPETRVRFYVFRKEDDGWSCSELFRSAHTGCYGLLSGEASPVAGNIYAFASTFAEIHCWNAKTLEPEKIPTEHLLAAIAKVGDPLITKDGNRFVPENSDDTRGYQLHDTPICLYDTTTGQEVLRIQIGSNKKLMHRAGIKSFFAGDTLVTGPLWLNDKEKWNFAILRANEK